MARNKDIVRRMSGEVYSQGKTEVLDEICAEGYVNHDPLGGDMSKEEEKALIASYRHAFPDFEVKVLRTFEEEGYACVHWRAGGTHEGELMDVEPTGRYSSVEGIDIARIDGGKIHEVWRSFDTLQFMRNIGVIAAVEEEEPRPSA